SPGDRPCGNCHRRTRRAARRTRRRLRTARRRARARHVRRTHGGQPSVLLPMAMLTARAVSRSYARRRVLRDVSFRGSAGTVVGLLGPNGAGKSLLLQILSGEMEPSSGTVRYGDGRPPAAARALLGVLGHEPQVYGELSARENLRLFARLAAV